MRWQGICYRGHDPRWAWAPTSGDGAKSNGARFNPAGTPALYLALSIEGVFAEQGHGFSRRLLPLTVCSYEVDVADIVDLRSEQARQQANIALADMACPWKLDLVAGTEPASWKITRRLVSEGAAGVLVPSFANNARADMSNLVLWRWGPDLPHKVMVIDPRRQLPRDQSSWPTES